MMRRTMILAAVAWVCATGTLLQSSAVSRHAVATTAVPAGQVPIAVRVPFSAVVTPSPPAAQAPGAAAASPAAHGAVLSKYCVTCHNDRLRTGGFVLDASSLGNAGATAESWERVVRKLRANA